MKQLLSFFCLLLIFSFVWPQSENEEFRATWVITWEHINRYDSVSENQQRVRDIMDNHVAANMNAVLWQARQSGTAYYNSSYEPWGYYAGGSYPGYDPLEYAIEQAHERGLELHAWFNVFQASSTAPGAPANEHPEWVCRDQDGNPMPSHRALSPGMDEVRAYTVDVAMEIVNNYDIDGLHLDYVRWNEYSDLLLNSGTVDPVEEISMLDGQISPEALDALLSGRTGRYLYDVDHPHSAGVPEGYASWESWWRASVTAFVSTLHDSIQAVKPWVRLSPAALGKYNWSGWNGYGVVYQDAALWFNEGYVDQLTPMHYHWTTSTGFYDMLTGNCPQCWSQWIQPGITAGRLFTVGPGSYRFAEDNVWHRHPGVVNTCRNIYWTDGFQFFSYGSWQDYQYWPIAGETFFNRMTKVRGSGIIDNEPPVAPTISLNQLDPLNFELSIHPPDTLSSSHWFVVYRSAEDGFSIDTSDIIFRGYWGSAEDIVVSEAFDGTQDHMGSYYYSATMLDRYWNESVLSDGVMSDEIPSFPPQVMGHTPEDGATAEVNTPILIEFSKRMDQATVEEELTVSPAVEVAEYLWSENDHVLQILPAANLEFLTSYTITLSENCLDINGTQLDGDGDGEAGDEYSFTFSTNEADETGPTITSLYPDDWTTANNFDVDAVVSFVFDEALDESTVDESSISFLRGTEAVDYDYLLMIRQGHHVLDIKSWGPLPAAEDYTVTLAASITDTLGNELGTDFGVAISTFNWHYAEVINIDRFTVPGNWWDPEGSGSTAGTIGSNTYFGYSTGTYLPASAQTPGGLKSAYINYEWDTSVDYHLLREYLSGGPARDIHFDTSYVLQCYVYGDGGMNQFRFAIDESLNGSDWPNHEVSQWITIDWEGWRLVEWDLGDPTTVGTWIGNEALDGVAYRIDSFQMTYDQEVGAVTGRVFFDDLRLVRKMPGVSIEDRAVLVPDDIRLLPAYPNPFNPSTTLSFELPRTMKIILSVFDVRGREVAVLFNGVQDAGRHQILFNSDGHPSGVYFVRLTTENSIQSERILLMK